MIKIGKYDFIKTENIVPVHKNYTWEYEVGYNGEKKKIEMKIYPYTVEEKLEMQNLNKKAKKLLEGTDEEKEEAAKLIEETTYKAGYHILKKEDPNITLEFAKKIPISVLNDISFIALEFEGYKRDQLEKEGKKIISELQK